MRRGIIPVRSQNRRVRECQVVHRQILKNDDNNLYRRRESTNGYGDSRHLCRPQIDSSRHVVGDVAGKSSVNLDEHKSRW